MSIATLLPAVVDFGWASRTEKTYWPEQEKIQRWGNGPWAKEPDLILWKERREFLYLGLIRRHDEMGNLMGYVLIHEAYPVREELDRRIRAHGGVNFMEKSNLEDYPVGIGFDCAHGYDIIPIMSKLMQFSAEAPALRRLNREYRDIHFVRDSVLDMIAQLEALYRT